MDYCIKNCRNVFIKLNNNGQPVTCGESMKGLFAEYKAKNILSCLPKPLRKMNFRVEPIPDIKPKVEVKQEDHKIIQNENYVVSEEISRWVDKFGACSDILEEARQREEELIRALEDMDKDIINVLHEIEFESSKDLYGGWIEYKKVKANREKRRRCKDELLIVQNVLKDINPNYLHRKRIQKAVDGLLKRKYAFRIIEDDLEEDNDQQENT